MPSLAERLLLRELGTCCGAALQKGWMRDAVRKLSVQAAFADPGLSATHADGWITQLLVTPTYVVTLTNNGRCMVYDKSSTQPVCCLNQDSFEQIKTLFYAPRADALFVVANRGGLLGLYVLKYSCRHLKEEAQACSGLELLGEEQVTHHGFIEFEESSERALVYMPLYKVYRLYDLGSLRLMYCITTDHVKDVHVGPLYLVLLMCEDSSLRAASSSDPDRPSADGAGLDTACEDDRVALRVLSAPNRMVLRQRRVHLGAPMCKMLVAGGFLVMQAGQCLHIYQLPSLASVAVVEDWAFCLSTQLLYMPEQDLLVAMTGLELSVWDFQGRRMPDLENHQLWYPEDESCCLVGSEAWVINYCQERGWGGTGLPSDMEHGFLHVSDVTSGRLLAQFGSRGDGHPVALTDVTAICFDPTECAIYTAYQTTVFKWSWVQA